MAVIITVLSLTVPVLHAQIISGSASVTLTGPATKEVSAQVQINAMKKLKTELLQWLTDESELTIDTANALQNVAFTMFLDSCRAGAKTESSFRGKELTLTYLLTGDNVRQKIQTFNAAIDTRALQSWSALKDAQARSDTRMMYTEGITALFYALARLGPPIATPDSGGRDLADDARKIVQSIFDRMELISSGQILSGKTGLLIQNPPTISLRLDSLPLPGITFFGRLQNGTVLFSASTDENGRFVVDNFKIPFVPNGTLFEICPNPASAMGLQVFLDPMHFGIKLNKNQVQTFIFKIARPVYSLDFKATSVSNITLPPDFADAAHVKKYLQDSCYLQEKGKRGPIDLDITIKTQVSSYTYDETEEIGIKVTSQITVNGLLLQPPKTKRNQMIFEKRYGRYLTPPYGLYFWEADGKLREAIKATIGGLED